MLRLGLSGLSLGQRGGVGGFETLLFVDDISTGWVPTFATIASATTFTVTSGQAEGRISKALSVPASSQAYFSADIGPLNNFDRCIIQFVGESCEARFQLTSETTSVVGTVTEANIADNGDGTFRCSASLSPTVPLTEIRVRARNELSATSGGTDGLNVTNIHVFRAV